MIPTIAKLISVLVRTLGVKQTLSRDCKLYVWLVHHLTFLNKTSQDLTRLPTEESTLDGRWTRKPFGLSRVQPIYLNVSRPSEVYVDFIFKHIYTTSTYTIS